ncbi:hypothetical protein [Nocardia mangyaensis]|uniref:hypothetical protein n=1 Tax=Nocardia mangyaensis TaxID=2213200 RepID=UPI002675EFCD|nr:hypothetical protein [Nocardia mangyaensis]MDO3647622.1 hypothetical protein [Nocardia mangyaensis]
MTAAFDDMPLQDLVRFLTEAEQQDLRPVVLRLVTSHEQPAAQVGQPPRRHLSFAGSAEAEPDFASSSQEILRRELGGDE